jgi:hypothetical protein
MPGVARVSRSYVAAPDAESLTGATVYFGVGKEVMEPDGSTSTVYC